MTKMSNVEGCGIGADDCIRNRISNNDNYLFNLMDMYICDWEMDAFREKCKSQ